MTVIKKTDSKGNPYALLCGPIDYSYNYGNKY